MHRPRMLPAVTACALTLPLAPAAGAATPARGTVIGAPTVAGSLASVPVLVSEATRVKLRLSDPVLRIRVPLERGIRARTGVLAPGALRIGDRVSATLRPAQSGTARTGVLRVTIRSRLASFDQLERSRTRASDRAMLALEEVAKLDATGSGVQGTPAASANELRARLEELRTALNLLVADLRAFEPQLGVVIRRIEEERPADPARREAVARRQQPLVAALRASLDQTVQAREALEAAVTRLDEAILDVGGTSAPALPIGTVGTVTDAVQAVLKIIGTIQPPSAQGQAVASGA